MRLTEDAKEQLFSLYLPVALGLGLLVGRRLLPRGGHAALYATLGLVMAAHSMTRFALGGHGRRRPMMALFFVFFAAFVAVGLIAAPFWVGVGLVLAAVAAILAAGQEAEDRVPD